VVTDDRPFDFLGSHAQTHAGDIDSFRSFAADYTGVSFSGSE
jgi:hypothetical protein